MAAEAWKTAFTEFFGESGKEFCDEVWPNLVAVDCGIKPCILWDVCTADTNALLALLDGALQRELLTQKLKVVEVNLDVFIVNVSSLIQSLTKIITQEESWLVDITNAEPKISSKDNHVFFRNYLVSLLSHLGVSQPKNVNSTETSGTQSSTLDSNSSHQNCSESNADINVESRPITITISDEVNLTTLFGCMLGYPQTYWWQGEAGENSLTGVPLKVFKFSAYFTPISSRVELFSFSIPESLESELRPGVERWGNVLNVSIEKSTQFSESKFICDPVLCLSVAV